MTTLTVPVPMSASPVSAAGGTPPAPNTLELLAEELSVTKKTVVAGRVCIVTHTRNHDAFVDETLTRHSVEISTIPLGVFVDAPPQIRVEGDVTIVPVVEEVVVVERRLRLKEELRITPIRTAERYQQKVTLRRQDAIVTRDQGERAAG